MRCILLMICLLGYALGDNSTFEERLEVVSSSDSFETDLNNLGTSGEWSTCTRTCGGGISRLQKRCRRKPCKGRPWSIKYKVCNVQPCDKPFDSRAEQCSAFDDVPYSDLLFKWFPYYDPMRPCALICRGRGRGNGEQITDEDSKQDRKTTLSENVPDHTEDVTYEEVVVQLADKVHDGTKCRPDSDDVCISGECLKVGCDMKIGSNKNRDACGVCGGNGSTCHSKYAWSLESASDCSESCGVGFKVVMAVCKFNGKDGVAVDNSNCDASLKPTKLFLPCNTHPCATKWLTGEWGKCSASCGGGTRTRALFCTEENGNATSKLPDYRCSSAHKPTFQEMCNAFSCPMWDAGQWSDCSVSCGSGVRTRSVNCQDGNGNLSNDCDPAEKPRAEQECRASSECSYYNDDSHSYQSPPVPQKLIDQPIPSESSFIADDWSSCSVTCGEGFRHREVHCKIFLEFSRTIVKLSDRQCSGPKPAETEKCVLEPCHLMENSLSYRIDTVGDSGYAESSLTDSYRSSSGSSGSAGYESGVKVAPGTSVQTTYSWKEDGYTDCSATCLGGVQDLIITCIRDDTGKAVMPLLCRADMKPESRIRICNDYPCPPRWNTSEFSPCLSPCGIGIQTRDVTCIHEVTRGAVNPIAVPNHMCPQPPPADRQYCNVWDCPVKWHKEEWSKCSASCGDGVKRRNITCEQIMAQGRKQSRPDRDCPSPRPSVQKNCNLRPCGQFSPSEQPIILSQNSTFIQEDPSVKVDLTIGGTATVFQGIPVVKIRCPVKKFDKAKLVWKKDRKAIHKSRKFKINKKGALRIADLEYPDSGVYSCVAGPTQVDMHLSVKSRPRDHVNHDDVLRSGNAVHHRQGSHLSSVPVNSEPAYGTFVFNEENQETRQQSYSKTTEKPRKRKSKTTASPSSDTGKYGEYIVTPHEQSGYQESGESSASSSGSTLVPHLSRLITTVKSYWPFQENTKPNNGRSSFINDNQYEEKATTHPTSGFRTDFRYDSIDKDGFNFFRENTAIPDKVFGPDEERIFIDDDPYLDDTLYTLEHRDVVRITPEVILEKRHSTGPAVTMVLPPQRHTKRKHENAYKEWHHTSSTPTGSTIDEETFTSHENPERHGRKRHDFHNLHDRTDKENYTTLPFVDDVETLRTINVTTDEQERILLSTEQGKIETVTIQEHEKQTQSGEYSTTISAEAIAHESTEDSSESFEEEKLEELEKLSGNELDNVTSDTEIVEKKSNHKTSMSPVVLNHENTHYEPTIGSVVVFSKAKDDLVFEWVTTEWSRCSQTCGQGGFQMRGAQCTVRSSKTSVNGTKISPRTVIGANLCEDAGYPVPEKVRPCGSGRCPQWHAGEWTSCESSRCFNWRTAMQRRDITCRLVDESDDDIENATITDPNQCDESAKPPQRQECYNDACKGVWRVGEWSQCSAPCEEDGIKYRILQCVWYGTKKPAGNACRDISRPTVMKTCKGPPCPKSPGDCKDHSQLCGRVKLMGMCQVPLYGKQCCESCR